MGSALISHREKVLAHAERQLVLSGKATPAELLALYKKFLKIENHRLRLRHRAGTGGRQNCEQRASLIDIILRHLFDTACQNHAPGTKCTGLSLIAVGGYGRGELNPFSDVDILFLHGDGRNALSPAMNAVIQAVLYMLWDVGFKVGHATRSIKGACAHANDDSLSKTALLEARHVTGDPALFERLKTAFIQHCIKGQEDAYIRDRVLNQAERHQKFGRTVFLQEPNVKNGCGGLRDYQNLLWISWVKVGARSTAALQEKKYLSEPERRRLDRAYDFLLRVRTELHYLNKRSTDSLSLNQQFHIANLFQYPEKSILRRGEAFMRDYYSHARDIFRITEQLARRLSVELHPKPVGFARFLPIARPTPQKAEHFDGFIARGGELFYESRDIFSSDPHRLMRLFQHLQTRGLVMSAELQQLVGHRLRYVNRTFTYSRAARETFLAILSRKGEVGRILRAMHEADFLGRYIPEFGALTCLVQHEFFHRYTADEHTLVCIEKLDELIDTEDPKLRRYRELFRKLEDASALYLALLLHDTGKASNARHHAEASAVAAQRVAARLQLSPDRRRMLIFLVDHHITLSGIAQRRNIDDPATIADFAGIIQTRERLDALMLLTLADGRGTSDESWSDWKESLVWQLYDNTAQYLADGQAFYRQRQIAKDSLREAATKKLARDYAGEIEAHFEYMPDNYFQTRDTAGVVADLRLFRKFLEMRYRDPALGLAPAIRWEARPERGHTEVAIVTWDRNDLLARIAGCFAVEQMNILSADIFTRGDSLVLDLFRVCNPKHEAVQDEKQIARAEKLLAAALAEENFDFEPLLAKAKKKGGLAWGQDFEFPTRIALDNDSHPIFTLIEVTTPDRLGLLHRLLRALTAHGINIALSRITTERGAAMDGFYVTDLFGNKVRDPSAITKLQAALYAAARGPA